MLPGTEINFNIDLCIFDFKKIFLPQRTIFISSSKNLSARETDQLVYNARLHAERESISDHGILFGNKNELITLDVGTNKYVNFQAKSIISFAMIV